MLRHLTGAVPRVGARPLTLISNGCTLPASTKLAGGKTGEDAFFSATPQVSACAVADGVGGWAEHSDVDPSYYSRTLIASMLTYASLPVDQVDDLPDPKDTKMRLTRVGVDGQAVTSRVECAEAQHFHRPLQVLSRAFTAVPHQVVRGGKPTWAGSSTVCAASVTGQTLQVCNVGDSGCLVLRLSASRSGVGWKPLLRTEEQTLGFNFPVQLGSASDSNWADAELYEAVVHAGDIVVLYTDGVSDNLSADRIIDVLNAQEQLGLAVEDAMSKKPWAPFVSESYLRAVSLSIAATAFAAGESDDVSPFQEAAERHNLSYMGGKPDDITVVVGVVAP